MLDPDSSVGLGLQKRQSYFIKLNRNCITTDVGIVKQVRYGGGGIPPVTSTSPFTQR
jgi:hypothetical protein